jgi:hypothetical protein
MQRCAGFHPLIEKRLGFSDESKGAVEWMDAAVRRAVLKNFDQTKGHVSILRVMICALQTGGFMAKRKRLVSVWSKEDVRNLRAFAKVKLSQPQAAKKLGRTPGAVAQKAMKLGIRFRSIRGKAG